jgi:hypothetical protein
MYNMINVGKHNLHILKKLLYCKLEEHLDSLPPMKTHNFSKTKPYYEVTLQVSAHEFGALVLQEENAKLKIKINRLES